MTGIAALRFVALGWAGFIAAEAGIADDWGYYFGVFVIVLAQCAGVPLPAVAVLLGAYASARGDLNLAAGYRGRQPGRHAREAHWLRTLAGGRPLMLRLAQRFHADQNRIAQLESFFDEHGWQSLVLRPLGHCRPALGRHCRRGNARRRCPGSCCGPLQGPSPAGQPQRLPISAGARFTIGDALDIGGWVLVPVVVLGLVIVWRRRRRRRRKLKSAEASGDGVPDAE